MKLNQVRSPEVKMALLEYSTGSSSFISPPAYGAQLFDNRCKWLPHGIFINIFLKYVDNNNNRLIITIIIIIIIIILIIICFL